MIPDMTSESHDVAVIVASGAIMDVPAAKSTVGEVAIPLRPYFAKRVTTTR